MKRTTIFSDPDSFCSFPSAAVLGSGKILVAFRQAGSFSAKAAREGRPTHHDPSATCRIAQSMDQGNSWSPTEFKWSPGGNLGVNDPALTCLSDGTLILRVCVMEVLSSTKRSDLQSPIAAHRPDLKTVSGVYGQAFFFSKDEGKTWSDPQWLSLEGFRNSASRDSVVELEDHVLLQPVYLSQPDKSEEAWVLRSWDGGKTWTDPALLARDERGATSMFRGTNFNESSLVNLGNGRLISILRSDSSYHEGGAYIPIGGVGELSVLFSDNAGFSWSAPQPTGIWGQPGHLLKLPDRKLLCTFGYRRKPYAVKACISHDEGNTWDLENIFTLKEGAETWDMGYPASVLLPEGKILSVFYWNDKSLIRSVESVTWSLSEFS